MLGNSFCKAFRELQRLRRIGNRLSGVLFFFICKTRFLSAKVIHLPKGQWHIPQAMSGRFKKNKIWQNELLSQLRDPHSWHE